MFTFGENYNAPCSAVSLRYMSMLFITHVRWMMNLKWILHLR